jgi:hypothetical protein
MWPAGSFIPARTGVCENFKLKKPLNNMAKNG